jgi:hypothetical protein
VKHGVKDLQFLNNRSCSGAYAGVTLDYVLGTFVA